MKTPPWPSSPNASSRTSVRDRKDVTTPRRYLEKDILPHIGSKAGPRYHRERTCAASSGARRSKASTPPLVRCVACSNMFDYALTCGLIQGQPGRHGLADAARLPRRRPRPGADAGRNPAVSACHADLNIRRQFKIAFQLILMTLVRKSERCWRSGQTCIWTKANGTSVENSDRQAAHRLPVTRRRRCSRNSNRWPAAAWVLPGRGTLAKSFANNALNQALKVSLQGRRILRFTIHDLRRTASTLLHEQGWPSDYWWKGAEPTIWRRARASTTGRNTLSSGRCCRRGRTTSTGWRRQGIW